MYTGGYFFRGHSVESILLAYAHVALKFVYISQTASLNLTIF